MWVDNGGQLDQTRSAGYFDGIRLLLEDTDQQSKPRREFVPDRAAHVQSQIVKFDATGSGVQASTLIPLYPSGDNYHEDMKNPIAIGHDPVGDWFNTSTYRIDVPSSTAIGASFLIDYTPQFYCSLPLPFQVKVTICESPPKPTLPVLLGVTANGGSFKWDPNFTPTTATYDSKISVQKGSGCVIALCRMTQPARLPATPLLSPHSLSFFLSFFLTFPPL